MEKKAECRKSSKQRLFTGNDLHVKVTTRPC